MSVELATGRNGLPTLLLSHPSGGQAEIYLYGAHLTSWTPAGGGEALFLSRAAKYEPGVPIRGGVPVIFPQFAELGPLPKHGFARVHSWRWTDSPGEAATATRATLELTDSPESRAIWPRAFRLELTVELGERSLTQRLSVRNTDEDAFTFSAALHTYLGLGDLRLAAIEGLGGAPHRERAHGDEDQVDPAAELVISGEVDRVYLDAPGLVRVHDRANRRVLEVRREGFADVVVWNPGAALTAKLPDMEPEEYLRMVCVEPAQVGHPVELPPGGRWEGAQRIEISATAPGDA